jgi:ribosomal protein S6E (S10)
MAVPSAFPGDPMHRIAIAMTCCFIALSLSACGKSPAERATEAAISVATGHKVDVDRNGGQMTIHTEQGDMQVNGGTLPVGFPKDVYLPASYTVESALEAPTAMVVHLLSPGRVAALSADASSTMQAQGWKSMMTMMQSAKGQVVMYEKGDRHATLTIVEDPGKGVQVGYQLAMPRQ